MLCCHGRFLFAVVLISYLCRDSIAAKPKISPATEQIILKEGEPLELRCSGNSESFFVTYPGNETNNHTFISYTSPVEQFQTKNNDGTYWYYLRRPKTVVGDTGWYGCSFHQTLTAIRNYSDPTISWIYVYVEPETVRFVEQADLETLVFTRDASIVVPCRPTSPNAKVQITGFVEEKNKKFRFTATFDPKFGFTLRNYIHSRKPVTFKCTIAPDQEVSYTVHMRGSNPLPEPIINNTFPHIIIGESLYVQCTISSPTDLENYDIFWMLPQQEHRITTWTENRTKPDFFFEKAAILEIKNVIYADSGIYRCKVTKIDIEKISEMYLQVHDSISPFIHLTARDSKSHYQRRVGDAVVFVVVVEAYPLPELKWLNKHGDELNTQGDEIPMLSWSRKSTLLADSACCKPMLKINNLDLNDMGIYSIQASNQYRKEILNFTLEVLAEPKVYMIMPHSRYFHNQVAKVECHVEAFPRPNITWSYRKCPNYPSCDDGILEYLTNSRENGTVTHLVSTVLAILEMSGSLICNACNNIGCYNVTKNVFVSDAVGEFGIIHTMDPVVEGDEWKLICAASTRNYSDTFDWSNESGPIVQSERISIDRESKQFTHRSILRIRNVTIEDSQEYVCTGKSMGNLIRSAGYRLEVTAARTSIVFKFPLTAIISLVMLAVVVLILVINVGFKIRHHRMGRRKLEESRFLRFEKGAVKRLNPDLTVDEQAHLLPYDKKWEFPREKLKLGKHLGSGEFGVVLKAEARGICEGEAVTTVAVKTVRNSPNTTHICALSSELKIMIHLGKHLNVVNLLGACTKNILKDELLVIVEFCRFGNLQNYLFRHRSGFINQIDPATGKLDLCIGHDLLTKTANVSSTNKVKSPSASIDRNLESDSAQCDAAATDFQSVDLSADDPTFNSDSTLPGLSSCRGVYEDSDLKPICTQDLLSWAFQVARGMEYLSQRRILHGDLAARNILLADDNVVKICDFGLAKSMYKEDIYKKKSDCPLPVKWLAIETMRDRIFSTQSDIWSFGIVLWEFFTLAKTPYPGMQSEIVYQKLIEGYRMKQPEYATREVYDIMCHCWNANPSLRPSFTDLVESIGNMLENNVRAQYIELNAPYMDMNRTLFEDGSSDYLSMVSDPNHVVYSSSSYSCEISSASGTTVDCGNSGIKIKDAVKTSPMLDEEDEDPYLKLSLITVDKRRAEIARMEALAKDRVMHPDQGYANCNPSNRLELTDLNKKSDKVAKRRRSSSIRETRRAA